MTLSQVSTKLYRCVFAFFSRTENRSESPSRQSRFSELLGKKEKDETKKQVPKSLDDFMANISSKSNTGSSAANKRGEETLSAADSPVPFDLMNEMNS